MNGFDQILRTQAGLAAASPQLAKLNQACQGLEAAFMKTLVSQMRKGTGEIHFGQELGGDMYRDMMDDTLSNMLAQKQGGGMIKSMADPMARQVLNQELATQMIAARRAKGVMK